MPLLDRIQLDGQPTADQINRLQTNIERALRRLSNDVVNVSRTQTVNISNPAATPGLMLAPFVADGGDADSDGGPFLMPGPPGRAGRDGRDGLPGQPGEDGEDSMIPGPPGPTGRTGIGLMGPPGMDGDDPDEPLLIVGPVGPRGLQGRDGMPAFDTAQDEDAPMPALPPTLSATSFPALTATFITQTPSSHLPNEQALSLLATGVMQSTTATGVVSTFPVGAGRIPHGVSPATGLLTDTDQLWYQVSASQSQLTVGANTTDAGANILAVGNTTAGLIRLSIGSDRTQTLNMGLNTTIGPFFAAHTGADGTTSSGNFAGVRQQFGGNGLIIDTSPATAAGVGRTWTERVRVAIAGAVTLNGANTANAAAMLQTNQNADQAAWNVVANSHAGTSVSSSFLLTNSQTDINNYFVMTLFGTGASTSGLLGARVGRIELSSNASPGNLIIGNASSTGDVVFYTTASRTERMRIATGGEVSIAVNATQTWYNVSGANYERVRAFWSSNVWTVSAEQAGAGTLRDISMTAANFTVRATTGATAVYAATSVTLGTFGSPRPDILIDTTSVKVRGNLSAASSASYALDAFSVEGTLSLSGTTHVTTPNGVSMTKFAIPSYNGGGSAKTVDYAATVRIDGAPLGVSGVTIGTAYSLWTAGPVRNENGVLTVFASKTAGTNLSVKPTDSNVAHVTGPTTVDTMWTGNDTPTTAWTPGSIVVLVCSGSGFTIRHLTGGAADYAQFDLDGNVSFAMNPGDTLTVYYNGSVWRELTRSIT